jgi:multimeric flavodoxin WrbA
MKKLLIVNATPKTDGLTYSYVKAAEETASKLGLDCKTLRLSSYNLMKCQMCYDGWGICFKEHYCVNGDGDGFSDLQEMVKDADAFVYVTPVYWGEMSEELKLFWDKLRRCETTKQWDEREEMVSYHKGKPSIIVAVAGGGGGGIASALMYMEHVIDQLGEHFGHQNGTAGIFDYIGVNRWNADYKLEALKSAIEAMEAINNGKKEPLPMNHIKDLEKF